MHGRGPCGRATVHEPSCWRRAQIEVERYFIDNGQLSPIYYPRYWINLNKTGSSWAWADGLTPGPGSVAAYSLSTYIHWGIYVDPFNSSNTSPEPNGSGFCAAADFLQVRRRGSWRSRGCWPAAAGCSGVLVLICSSRSYMPCCAGLPAGVQCHWRPLWQPAGVGLGGPGVRCLPALHVQAQCP
jgi:hypothetical protein